MGSPLESFDGFEGAYYTGAGSGEMIWLIIAIALCVAALVMGARHELDAYKKADKK
ncbi:MAG: hypothetical protein AAFR93_04835 [Pseudomonadota bacterium]